KAGVLMQLDLMMESGRAVDVRATLEPDHVNVLGFSAYHWLQAQAAAACGDYPAVDAELDLLTADLRLVRTSPEQLLPVRSAMAFRVGNAVLARPAFGAGPAGLAGVAYLQFDALKYLPGLVGLLQQEADFRVLRGLLALESGAVDVA